MARCKLRVYWNNFSSLIQLSRLLSVSLKFHSASPGTTRLQRFRLSALSLGIHVLRTSAKWQPEVAPQPSFLFFDVRKFTPIFRRSILLIMQIRLSGPGPPQSDLLSWLSVLRREILRNIRWLNLCPCAVWELVWFYVQILEVRNRSIRIDLNDKGHLRSFFSNMAAFSYPKWFQWRRNSVSSSVGCRLAASQTSDLRKLGADWAHTSIKLCLGCTGGSPNHRIRRNQAMIDGLAAVDRAIGTSAT